MTVARWTKVRVLIPPEGGRENGRDAGYLANEVHVVSEMEGTVYRRKKGMLDQVHLLPCAIRIRADRTFVRLENEQRPAKALGHAT
jgi:hypothetical protein